MWPCFNMIYVFKSLEILAASNRHRHKTRSHGLINVNYFLFRWVSTTVILLNLFIKNWIYLSLPSVTFSATHFTAGVLVNNNTLTQGCEGREIANILNITYSNLLIKKYNCLSKKVYLYNHCHCPYMFPLIGCFWMICFKE